jgi:hypothetical protein
MKPDAVTLPGLSSPLRIYLFADIHMQAHAAGNSRIPESWRQNPSPRLPSDSATLLHSHLDRAVHGGADLILACGDLFHFPTPENRDLVLEARKNCSIPIWTVPGNHDWFFPGQDGWEALRTRQLHLLDDVFGPQPSFWIKSMHGLRVLGLDNSTYFLSSEQVDFLKNHLRQPESLIVMMHIPLSLPGLREKVIAKHGNPILMADPEGRVREGIDPAPTAEAVRLLTRSDCVKGIVAAHVHLPDIREFAPGKTQWIPEAGYRNGFQWLNFSP